jgi:regulator of sigma E protease
MIFSPSTGAYKQVGGFKAIFDIFPILGLEGFSGTSLLIIDYAWCNELIIPALDGGHVMFFYYMKLSVVKNQVTNS